MELIFTFVYLTRKLFKNIYIMETKINNEIFNGFASEEQYEAVMKIIKTKIDCDTLMIDYYENNVVRVFVDDKIYRINKYDGVVEIEVKPDSPYVSYEYLLILYCLDKLSSKIFETIEDYEVQAEYDAYNSQFNFGI